MLVCGARFAGLAAARALVARGAAQVLVTDQNPPAEPLPDGADFVGDLTELPDGIELVVTSPGWRPSHVLFVEAVARGIEVIGEVEFAWRLRGSDAPPWLALTGTNGKTTTVRMLESILQADGRRAIAVGNVGVSIIDAVLAGSDYDVLAVELSSFQLYWSSTVHPLAGAILNLAPDHLDWHGTMAEYVAAKAKIWNSDVAIANADDRGGARSCSSDSTGRRARSTFTLRRTGRRPARRASTAFLADASVRSARRCCRRRRRSARAVVHNVANALAASALALAYGVATRRDRGRAAGIRARPAPQSTAGHGRRSRLRR